MDEPARLDQLILPFPLQVGQQERHVVEVALLFSGQVQQHAAGRFVDVGVLRAGGFVVVGGGGVVAEGVEEEEGRGAEDGVAGWTVRYALRFRLLEYCLRVACLRQQHDCAVFVVSVALSG